MTTPLHALSRHASQVRKNAVRLLSRGKRVPAREEAAMAAMADADTAYIAGHADALDARAKPKKAKRRQAREMLQAAWTP